MLTLHTVNIFSIVAHEENLWIWWYSVIDSISTKIRTQLSALCIIQRLICWTCNKFFLIKSGARQAHIRNTDLFVVLKLSYLYALIKKACERVKF